MAKQTDQCRPNVEIERKFIIPFNIEKLLTESGASRISKNTFLDIYYDTDENSLALSDHWLRTREGQWQLKYPIPESVADKRSNCATTVYVEAADEIEIHKIITECLRKKRMPIEEKDEGKISDVIGKLTLREFASITTERTTYQLRIDDDEWSVVLDKTNFGYDIGEIELMVANKREVIHAAMERLDAAMKLLGLGEHALNGLGLASKLSAFLHSNNRSLYRLLTEQNIIRPIDGAAPFAA